MNDDFALHWVPMLDLSGTQQGLLGSAGFVTRLFWFVVSHPFVSVSRYWWHDVKTFRCEKSTANIEHGLDQQCSLGVAQWTAGDSSKKGMFKEFFCSFPKDTLSALGRQTFSC